MTKDTKIEVRLTLDEKVALTKRAEEAGLTASALIRRAVLEEEDFNRQDDYDRAVRGEGPVTAIFKNRRK